VEESGDYTHLPDTLQEWLAGQKHVLFEGQAISTAVDMVVFYKKYYVPLGAISEV
jgi:hypothetical protein